MSREDSVDVSVVPATPGIRLVSAEGQRLQLAEPVIAWEIHRALDAQDNAVSTVYPITINGADYQAYGVQYADGTVSGFGAYYDSIEEAQSGFPNADV